MYDQSTKPKKRFYNMMMLMSIFSLLAGLLGCGGAGQNASEKISQIVSVSTSYHGMSRSPTYAFALYQEDGNWFFSATYSASSFSSFPIPAEDAEGLLEILRETDEIKRLTTYREPFLARLFGIQVTDAPMRYSGIVFAGSESLERETSLCAKALDYLYDLAEKHRKEAEKLEIVGISVCRESPDPLSSCSFTLKTDGFDWFLSFSAVPDSSGNPTKVENLQIETHDADEILRLVKEQQLIKKVKQYEKSTDDETTAFDETICQTSFQFMDGSSICAPIDAGTELIDAFCSLAQANI